MNAPMIFCNIGWMTNYLGLNGTGDNIKHGGAYVNQKGTGHEVCNFLRCHDGNIYGYVESQVGKRDTLLSIKKLGALPGASSIGGITVVWTALSDDGGKRVVGWYRNATVFAARQKHAIPPSAQHTKDRINTFRISATAENVVLLPPPQRVLRLKTNTTGWPGIKAWWYAPGKNPTTDLMQFLSQVDQLVTQKGSAEIDIQKAVTGGGWGAMTPDPERNAAVEKRAIRIVSDWYGKRRRQIAQHAMKSVEKENLGWDLEAKPKEGPTLQLEVKGRSSSDRQVGLSPNEFKAFREHIEGSRPNYRLCIVTNALSKHPSLTIGRYDAAMQKWINVKSGDEELSSKVSLIEAAIVDFE